MSDIDDFAQGLAEMSPAGAEAPPVHAVEEPQPQLQEQPQEPAQRAPAEEPAPTPEPAPEPPKVPEPGYVPLAALLDERDKAKRFKSELEQYRAQQQPVQAPNAYDQPEEWAAYQQQQFDQRLLAERFTMSDAIARTVHGDKVDAAKDWAMQQANTVPGFAEQYIAQANPVDWAVKQHRQSQLLNQIGDVPDLDQWIEQQAAARGFVKAGGAPAPSPQPMAPQVRTPTRSLAAAPSAGGNQAPAAGGLDAIFPGIT